MSWVTQCSRQRGLGLLVKNVHLILVQAFGTAELQPPLTSTKVQVLLSVANMFAPVTHLQQKTQTVHMLHQHLSPCIQKSSNLFLVKYNTIFSKVP